MLPYLLLVYALGVQIWYRDCASLLLGGASNQETNIDELIAFLETNTKDVRYLVAVPSANEGDRYVLATGRPVLYMGGFTGDDPVVDVDDLTQMVANGELRYILWGRLGTAREMEAWIRSHGTLVEGMGLREGWGLQLYKIDL